MVWGSKRGGHGVPKEVRPLKGQGRATWQPRRGGREEARRASADVHTGWRGAGGDWRKLCWDPVHFLNKTEARLAAGRKGGGEVLAMTRERRRMVV